MYNIFFINNIELSEKVWTAEEIMNSLLENNLWAFSYNAPNLKYLNEGNRVVAYLAGKGNRYFAADFTIASKPYEAQPEPSEPEWLGMFPFRIDVRDIKIWEKHLPIGDVLAHLDFIKDKKNYGLYFRRSIKVVEEKDFLIILGGK